MAINVFCVSFTGGVRSGLGTWSRRQKNLNCIKRQTTGTKRCNESLELEAVIFITQFFFDFYFLEEWDVSM